jgi:hypothetical protein
MQVKPFVGPQAFEESDSSFFYGRDREVQEILALILSGSISLVYAKSGIGKSSIFNAKVIPDLKGKKYKVQVLPMPRFNAMDTLNFQIANKKDVSNVYIFNTIEEIIEKSGSKEELGKDENFSKGKLRNITLSEFLVNYNRVTQQERVSDKYYHELKILIFDQFEEFFNVYVNNSFEQQENFFYQIRDAIRNDPNLRIVFVMREEFIANLDTFSQILPDGFRRKFRLEPLRKEQAINAVERPLLQAMLLEPGLNDIMNEQDIKKIADKVVDSLLQIYVQRYDGAMTENKERSKFGNKVFKKIRKVFEFRHSKMLERDDDWSKTIRGEFVEPVQLQVVCLKLWENKILTGKIQNEIDSIAFGDVDNALTDFYVDAVKAAKADTRIKEPAIRRWCEEKLITSAGTRNMVYHDANFTAGMSNKVVSILQSKYLVHAEERARGKWFELTHDRLIKPIKDSNKKYEEAKKKKEMKIIKIMVPVIVTVALAALYIVYPFIEPINAEDGEVETLINNNVTIKLNNTQGKNLAYVMKTYPTNGELLFKSNDTLVYEPDNRYIGYDGFSYVATNGKKNSNTGLIDIYVKPINLIAMNHTVESVIDKPLILSLIDWDYPTYTTIRDVGKLSIKLLDTLRPPYNNLSNGPYNGYLATDIDSNKVVYTPHKGFNGSDYFEFCLPNPENGDCSTNQGSFGYVNLTIRPVPKYLGFLMVDSGITKGTLYPIYSTTNTIGRATSHDKPDIAIDDDSGSVSRLNAKLFYKDGSFFLQDLESTNKVISKGKQLQGREVMELQGGDTFVLGGINGIRMRLITDLTNTTQYEQTDDYEN